MAVDIVVDMYGIYTGEPRVTIRSSADYVRARKWFHTPDGEFPTGAIVVRNRSHASWFDDLAESGAARIVVMDPRRELRQALRVSHLPAAIEEDPAAIVELEMLTKALVRPRGVDEDAEDWCLRTWLGAVWGRGRVSSPADISAVVMDLAQPAEPAPLHPTIAALRAERLREWAAADTEFHAFLTWVAEAPQRRASTFLLAQALRGYLASVVREVLSAEGMWNDLCALSDWQVWCDRVPLHPAGSDLFLSPGAGAVLRQFLERTLHDGLSKVLGMVSGCLVDEARTVERYVESAIAEGTGISVADVDSLQREFARCRAARKLLRLSDELRPVPAPSKLDSNAAWADVRRWLAEEYLPFYHHRALLGRLADTVAAVESFENWLISAYAGLTREPECFVCCLPDHLKRLLAQGPILFVVVDALGWPWCRTLLDALADHGLHAADDPRLLLSLLPSLTKVSKPCMLRGRLPSQLESAFDTTEGYVRALATSTEMATEDIAAGTDRDSDVESIAYEGRRLTFFCMTEMDEKLVHRPLREHVRREKIRQYLCDLADAVSSAAQIIEGRCREAPTVAIVGDHGYTCLGRDVGRGILIADGVKATHGRAAYSPIGHPADSVAVLQAEDFMLREEVAVARSYHYFEPRPRGAVHGGMTPQELAVPLIVVSTVQPESLRDLEIIVSGSVIRGRRENEIEIKVTNPNRQGALLQSLRLRLTRIVSTIPAEIPAEGMHTITAVVDGSSVTSSEIVLSGAMHWKAAGREQTTHVEARVSTQGAAATEQEFERLFE